jgi:hypothetical protein
VPGQGALYVPGQGARYVPGQGALYVPGQGALYVPATAGGQLQGSANCLRPPRSSCKRLTGSEL